VLYGAIIWSRYQAISKIERTPGIDSMFRGGTPPQGIHIMANRQFIELDGWLRQHMPSKCGSARNNSK